MDTIEIDEVFNNYKNHYSTDDKKDNKKIDGCQLI